MKRIAQVVDSKGEGYIALIVNGQIVSRHASWTEARKAYRAVK